MARRPARTATLVADRAGAARLALFGATGLAMVLMASATQVRAAEATAPPAPSEVQEVVVNGIPYHETVLPTRMTSSSVYGLDLNVMDTPRNTTLLSTTQLETLNVQDPRAFSYLTASSYTDSAFGTPNIPRIRGQFADVFYNGMRSSFSENGYGVPPNFDDLDTISITKGPASVVYGPGPGVGGEVDFITKRPNMFRFKAQASLSLDSVDNHRITLDVGGPITPGVLGLRLSYSGEDSGSWFPGHFFRRNALYAAVRWQPNERYTADFNTELNVSQYTENVGVNRVSQALIDHQTYLTGAPTGELFSALIGAPGFPVGSAANPYSPITPILTVLTLGHPTRLNTRTTIDQTPGTFTQAIRYNAQFIQTWKLGDRMSVENNTFFDYQDSENREAYYYSDASRGSWTLENRTELKTSYDIPFGLFGSVTTPSDGVVGLSARFAHVSYIANYNAETPAAFDLTTSPRLWTWDLAALQSLGNAYPYKTPFDHIQYGVPGRDSVNFGNTGVSNLTDVGLFFQDRLQMTPRLSLLFGGRLDAVQNHSYDPLGGKVCDGCFNTLPQSHSTDVYGLANANLSAVYRARSWLSTYVTFDLTQSVNPNGGEGGINTYTQVPDREVMRETSYLYEAGAKLNLLGDKLFVGAAVFDQKRGVPVGAGGTQTSQANIRGVEIEANFQPTRNFFATASYSYIQTTLNRPASFYNYPAAAGQFIDGAGLFAVFAKGQTFDDPGIPEHVFNVLVNYKFDNGVGLRSGLQVTGPIELTQSGQLDLAASEYVPAFVVANHGYYRSPTIPWQYTLNASVFYEWDRYSATLSVYNLTDQLNWQSSPPFYGNDFLVRNDPRTVEVRLVAKY